MIKKEKRMKKLIMNLGLVALSVFGVNVFGMNPKEFKDKITLEFDFITPEERCLLFHYIHDFKQDLLKYIGEHPEREGIVYLQKEVDRFNQAALNSTQTLPYTDAFFNWYIDKILNGCPREIEYIAVTNKTSKPLYVSIYLERNKKNDKNDLLEPIIFGGRVKNNILEIPAGQTEDMIRPERRADVDRKLYFSTDEKALTRRLTAAQVRRLPQSKAIGNLRGTNFTITEKDLAQK